ncbi:MAG: glycosyltransferase family 9 protein [Syntrophaceae bacterium]|nr:glycosyltransferase family 9 protein [Syntrophaceae bacterium]
MKRLDSWVGFLLCLALSALHLPFARQPQRVKNPPDRILLIKFFGLGSILQATPLLRSLRRHFPRASIGFLTFESNRVLLDRQPFVDRLFTIRREGLLRIAVDTLGALWKVRKYRPDVTLDLEYFAKFSTLVSFLSGARTRIGFQLPKLWRGALLTHPVFYNDHRHISEIFGALGIPLGLKLEELDFQLGPLHIWPREREMAVRLLDEFGFVSSGILVGINPNTSDLCLERRWPLERFAALIERLSREENVRVYLTGSAEESSYVGSLLNRLTSQARTRTADLSGRTGIGTFLALLERTALFITNDSGPLHFACAVGTPTLSFFGPETPVRFGPRSGFHRTLYASLYCSPCLNVYSNKSAPCGGQNRCMTAISLEDAWSLVQLILQGGTVKERVAV